ncbi:hypothetical protein [Amycolatopsis australiensis]|uniref:CU044_5270 family protein n=1 Tax=Amycolatopsis australiensis TaxID=546364 RepID=A0A1K1QJQ7_9PSEU|nr:hypothetical protein [Amycolatopsis australiensis]SFW60005.1 hypothetical protein SAMN04489730_1882 [Amycolatopsis australiensis]
MREDNVRKIWSDAELDAALADLHDDAGEDDGLAFARASLMTAAGTPEAPPQRRRRGSWRWIAVAAAVVTLVGGLAVVVSLRPPAPDPAGPAVQPVELDRPLVPGEFHYTQKLAWVLQPGVGRNFRLQQEVELWIPADPAGVWHRRSKWTGAIRDWSPEWGRYEISRAAFDEYGPGGVFPGQPPANWLTPDAAFVASLTPDRAQLAKALSRDIHTPSGTLAGAALASVRNVLALGLVRSDVRLALRDTLIAFPGVKAEPSLTPDGRPATVISAADTDRRLYLDPATARLLATTDGGASPANTEAPVSTSPMQPSSTSEPRTTTNAPVPVFPPRPEKFTEPEAVYSYAITRSSG